MAESARTLTSKSDREAPELNLMIRETKLRTTISATRLKKARCFSLKWLIRARILSIINLRWFRALGLETKCLMLLNFKSFSRSTPTSGQIVRWNLLESSKNHRLHLCRDPLCTNWDQKAQLLCKQDSLETLLSITVIWASWTPKNLSTSRCKK